MNEHSRISPSVRGVIWLATLFVALWAGGVDRPALALVLLSLGVPHGGADHLIHRLTSRRQTGRMGFAGFYLGVMSGLVVMWLLLPALAFTLFIAVSVYHFGQTRGGGLTDQLIWGCFFLGFPVLVHFPEARPIIEGMLHREIPLPHWIGLAGPVILAAAAGANALRSRQEKYLIDLVVLCLLYLSCGLMLGFAVFFLFWHSLPASLHQYAFIRQRARPEALKTFARELLPLAMAAVVYLLLVYGVLFGFSGGTPPLSRVFVLISVITLPHALLVDRVYRSAS